MRFSHLAGLAALSATTTTALDTLSKLPHPIYLYLEKCHFN